MKFVSKYDRLAIWLTIITLIIVAAFGSWIYLRSASSFLPAWITILLWALFALVLMSVPRYVEVTPDGVEINCTVEITYIPFNEIRRIKIFHTADMRWCIPVAGVFGYFGYYGYYFDFKKWRLFKLYSRNRKGYIFIETIYEKRYVLGIDKPLEFIHFIEKNINQQ